MTLNIGTRATPTPSNEGLAAHISRPSVDVVTPAGLRWSPNPLTERPPDPEVTLRSAQTQIAVNWQTFYRTAFGTAPKGRVRNDVGFAGSRVSAARRVRITRPGLPVGSPLAAEGVE
jgi:hypothetical protein